MHVLRPVEEARRRNRWLVTSTALATFGLLFVASLWWLGRSGSSIDAAYGVELPRGSRLIHREYGGDDYESMYISTTSSPDETAARVASIAVARDSTNRRFTLRDGTVAIIAPAEDVPATRMVPIRPVSGSVPLGTGSWIVLTRGVPPRATWTAAVPPDLGES
jgi:hypothetical protein